MRRDLSRGCGSARDFANAECTGTRGGVIDLEAISIDAGDDLNTIGLVDRVDNIIDRLCKAEIDDFTGTASIGDADGTACHSCAAIQLVERCRVVEESALMNNQFSFTDQLILGG